MFPFFVKFLKWKLFFWISLAIPHPLRSGIHWPSNFSKKIENFVYFQKKKNYAKNQRVYSWGYIFLFCLIIQSCIWGMIALVTSWFIWPCKNWTDARFGITQFVMPNTYVLKHPGVWSRKKMVKTVLVMWSQTCGNMA